MKKGSFIYYLCFVLTLSAVESWSQSVVKTNCTTDDFYKANLASHPPKIADYLSDRQNLLTLLTNQRNDLARFAEIYVRSGTNEGIQKFEQLRPQIQEFDKRILKENQRTKEEFNRLYTEQSYFDVLYLNDPRRLSGILSKITSANIQIQPRQDCKYNILSDGREIENGLSSKELITYSKKLID